MTRRARAFITIAYGVLVTIPASASDPWADSVVDAHAALTGEGLYDDPQSVLGSPSTTFFDTLFSSQYVVSLVSGPFNLSAPDGEKLVTSIGPSQFIKVGFNEPVCDEPRNPFGIDLLVFGNSFFIASMPVLPESDLAEVDLSGLIFTESIVVSVSETGIGSPTSHPDHWHTYGEGPFADGLLPSNPFSWDPNAAAWGAPQDLTVASNPALESGDFAQLSVPEAIDQYQCGGGGTGFDLSESGLGCISFVYLEGNNAEVDALADVFPVLGDFDRNGLVDLSDVSQMQTCFTDPSETSYSCACRSADFNGDGLIDLDDYAMFWEFLAGP